MTLDDFEKCFQNLGEKVALRYKALNIFFPSLLTVKKEGLHPAHQVIFKAKQIASFLPTHIFQKISKQIFRNHLSFILTKEPFLTVFIVTFHVSECLYNFTTFMLIVTDILKQNLSR